MVDINGLFVSICCVIGILVCCVYGLWVVLFCFFCSFGLVGDNVSCGYYVCVEFYVLGYGWIFVDLSDVCWVIVIEGLLDCDSKLLLLKKIFFGVWEMNWIVFNVGIDVMLFG